MAKWELKILKMGAVVYIAPEFELEISAKVIVQKQ